MGAAFFVHGVAGLVNPAAVHLPSVGWVLTVMPYQNCFESSCTLQASLSQNVCMRDTDHLAQLQCAHSLHSLCTCANIVSAQTEMKLQFAPEWCDHANMNDVLQVGARRRAAHNI